MPDLLTALPTDLQLHILSFLPPGKPACVSRMFEEVERDDGRYREFILKEFGLEIPHTIPNLKRYYERLKLLKIKPLFFIICESLKLNPDFAPMYLNQLRGDEDEQTVLTYRLVCINTYNLPLLVSLINRYPRHNFWQVPNLQALVLAAIDAKKADFGVGLLFIAIGKAYPAPWLTVQFSEFNLSEILIRLLCCGERVAAENILTKLDKLDDDQYYLNAQFIITAVFCKAYSLARLALSLGEAAAIPITPAIKHIKEAAIEAGNLGFLTWLKNFCATTRAWMFTVADLNHALCHGKTELALLMVSSWGIKPDASTFARGLAINQLALMCQIFELKAQGLRSYHKVNPQRLLENPRKVMRQWQVLPQDLSLTQILKYDHMAFQWSLLTQVMAAHAQGGCQVLRSTDVNVDRQLKKIYRQAVLDALSLGEQNLRMVLLAGKRIEPLNILTVGKLSFSSEQLLNLAICEGDQDESLRWLPIIIKLRRAPDGPQIFEDNFHPLSFSCFITATKVRKIRVLQFLQTLPGHDENFEYDKKTELLKLAMNSGSLEVIEYLRKLAPLPWRVVATSRQLNAILTSDPRSANAMWRTAHYFLNPKLGAARLTLTAETFQSACGDHFIIARELSKGYGELVEWALQHPPSRTNFITWITLNHQPGQEPELHLQRQLLSIFISNESGDEYPAAKALLDVPELQGSMPEVFSQVPDFCFEFIKHAVKQRDYDFADRLLASANLGLAIQLQQRYELAYLFDQRGEAQRCAQILAPVLDKGFTGWVAEGFAFNFDGLMWAIKANPELGKPALRSQLMARFDDVFAAREVTHYTHEVALFKANLEKHLDHPAPSTSPSP